MILSIISCAYARCRVRMHAVMQTPRYHVYKALRRTFNAQPYNSTIYTKKSPRHHLGDDSICIICYHRGIQIDGSRKHDTVTFLGLAPRNNASISFMRSSVSFRSVFSLSIS